MTEIVSVLRRPEKVPQSRPQWIKLSRHRYPSERALASSVPGSLLSLARQLLVVSLLPITLNVYFSWDRRSKSLRREWPISDSVLRAMVAIQRSFLIFTLMTVIVGRTDAEAQAKYDGYRCVYQPRRCADPVFPHGPESISPI